MGLPGAVVIPKNYGTEVIVYSAAFGWKGVVDGAPPRENGRLFIIEPGKAKKVPYEVWRYIEQHYPYSDVVAVNQAETDQGVTYDIAAAREESMAKGAEADLAAFKAYIGAAVEDFVKRNKPVPQPSDNILAIIERRGYDLKKFGIVPIGWEEPEKDARVAQLEAQVQQLADKLAAASLAEDREHKAEAQLAALQAKEARIAELESQLEEVQKGGRRK
jgi:hypothetical protein